MACYVKVVHSVTLEFVGPDEEFPRKCFSIQLFEMFFQNVINVLFICLGIPVSPILQFLCFENLLLKSVLTLNVDWSCPPQKGGKKSVCDILSKVFNTFLTFYCLFYF